MNKDQCKETVMSQSGWHSFQCSRKPKLDGYCKQHHPDEVKKRDEARHARWDQESKVFKEKISLRCLGAALVKAEGFTKEVEHQMMEHIEEFGE